MGSLRGVFPIIILSVMMVGSVAGIGANWGTQATHPLPPSTVVKLLRDNGIDKVKLFDAEYAILDALSGSGIEVMVGIPNDMLYSLATSVESAELWVERNVSIHVSSNKVNIRYVSVGNEPFLNSFNGTFLNTLLPALKNIQAALVKAGLANQVKVTVPQNADVYESSTTLPSGGDFRADIHDLMIQIVQFLSDNNCPFTVNIYPFISLYLNPSFPTDFAFFDGYSSPLDDNGKVYTNVFDANHDTLVWALNKNGFGNMSIIVGEIGWPTDGDISANNKYAQKFNQGFMSHVSGGTPMRPTTLNAYLFSLIDEDAKSIDPGNFERHWGIFNFDGTLKYNFNIRPGGGGLVAVSGIQYLSRQWCVLADSASLDDPQLGPSVSYACSHADCTDLGYGTSCGNLDARMNVSFAFNSYYQENDQLATACKFPNLSVISNTDPSNGDCKFKIMIKSDRKGNQISGCGPSIKPATVIVFLLVLFANVW